MDRIDSTGANSPKMVYDPGKDIISINPPGKGRPYKLNVHDDGKIHPDLLRVYNALTGATDEKSAVKPGDRLGRIISVLSQDGSVFLDVLEQQGLCPELLNYDDGVPSDGAHETHGGFGQTNTQESVSDDSRPIYPSDITPEIVLCYLNDLKDTETVQNPGFLAKNILDVDRAPLNVMRRIDKLLNELIEDGLVHRNKKWIHHKLTKDAMRLDVYEITSEGTEYLATGVLPEGLPDSAYHRHDEPTPVRNVPPVSIPEPTKIGVLETLYNLTNEGIIIHTLQYLTNKTCEIKHGSAPKSMKDEVYKIVQDLENRGCMSITQKNIKVRGGRIKHLVYEITDKGIEYLENVSTESTNLATGQSAQIITETTEPKDRTIEEDESPVSVYGVKYNWNDLHADICKEFGAEDYLHYTTLDSTEGFPGAVYVRLDDDVFCAGYVDEFNKLIPCPETIHVLSISGNAGKGKKPGRHAHISFFKTLDDSSGASGIFSKLMSNNIDEVANLVYNGMYRNTGELTTNKGYLSDRGHMFFDAVIELFGKDSFSVVDSKGDEHTISGRWFDISKYVPKHREPVREKQDDTFQPPPRKPKTIEEIHAILNEE